MRFKTLFIDAGTKAEKFDEQLNETAKEIEKEGNAIAEIWIAKQSTGAAITFLYSKQNVAYMGLRIIQ
jgi:hypothetical protein